MKIIVDSSSLYSNVEGKKKNITVLPVRVNFNGKSYKDYDEISTDEIISHIVQGAVPKSSQPAVGEVMEAYEKTDDEVLAFTIGDGLSGTYSNFVGAKNSIDNGDRVHVIDTQTLAGAYHYIVDKAVRLKDEGLNIQQIKDKLQDSIEHCWSYVIPTNFTFLKRSGRLSPLAANAAGFMKIVPSLTLSEDRRKIELLTMTRTVKKAIDEVVKSMKANGVNDNYEISVSHAGVCERAKETIQQLKESFTNATFRIFELSPSLVLHGGPGCIVIQAVKK